MLHFLLWYVLITILGLITFPILASLLPNLADKGYIFSRIFGLLVWGYLYWLGGILGITDNAVSGLLFAFLILVGGSLLALRKQGWVEMRRWMSTQRSMILVTEVLFLLAFAGWAYVRSFTPEIAGTEKPMELAFINAILRADTFPPHDPWLSGYAISYYYFGYVMVAMLAKLTATAGSVAFNLGVSLIFAMSALGSFGVLFNVITLSNPKDRLSPEWASLLGPFFTLIVSNWEGFLHFLHSRGLFWTRDASGQWVSGFWRWLDIRDLVNPPTGQSFGHWWWWRASRVIQDVDYYGNGREVISEFPFFSYLLGDLHPHVLAMPFAFLLMTMAVAVFSGGNGKRFRWAGLFTLDLSPKAFLAVALAAGGMSFLNTWDFPIYVALLAGAYAFRGMVEREDWRVWALLKDFISFGVAVGLSGILLYLPFFISFASQAGGLIPNILFITPGSQLWVMFGPLFLPLFGFLFFQWRKHSVQTNLLGGAGFSLGLWIALLLFSLSLIVIMPMISPVEGIGSVVDIYLNTMGSPSLRDAAREGLLRRMEMPGTSLTLLLMGTLAFGLLWKAKSGVPSSEPSAGSVDQGVRFSLLLVLGGMILVLVPEFVYLRDFFGYRINTIFKFYYQAWLMWSVVAAFGTALLLNRLRLPWRSLAAVLFTSSVVMALVYPVMGIWTRTNGFQPLTGRGLDGAVQFEVYTPDDAAGAAWLKDAPSGVIAESVGGSYSAHARMSTYSGHPTILGWDGHENQWRGGSELVNPRREDVRQLYCTSQWPQAEDILRKYEVTYVVVGNLERSTYTENLDTCPGGLDAEKFSEHLEVLFQQGSMTIYGP